MLNLTDAANGHRVELVRINTHKSRVLKMSTLQKPPLQISLERRVPCQRPHAAAGKSARPRGNHSRGRADRIWKTKP